MYARALPNLLMLSKVRLPALVLAACLIPLDDLHLVLDRLKAWDSSMRVTWRIQPRYLDRALRCKVDVPALPSTVVFQGNKVGCLLHPSTRLNRPLVLTLNTAEMWAAVIKTHTRMRAMAATARALRSAPTAVMEVLEVVGLAAMVPATSRSNQTRTSTSLPHLFHLARGIKTWRKGRNRLWKLFMVWTAPCCCEEVAFDFSMREVLLS